MKSHPQKFIKNLLVAATMCAAAVASWAVTDFRVPAIEAAAPALPRG